MGATGIHTAPGTALQGAAELKARIEAELVRGLEWIKPGAERSGNWYPWLITIQTPFQHHTVTAQGPGLHSTTLLPDKRWFDPIDEVPYLPERWADPIDEPHLFVALEDDGILVTQTGAGYSGSAWGLMHRTFNAEQGVFFVAADGDATFKNRVAFSGVASSATYGPEPADLTYTDIALLYDDDLLVNKATVTANTGGPQTSSDATSITGHGPHSIRLTSRSLLAANEALNVAEFIVGKRKDVLVRITGFTVKPISDPSNLWPEVLTRELQEVVTVKYDDLVGDVLNQAVAIENINHNITEDNWTVTYRCQVLSTFETQDYWILDTSQLDTGTRLA